MSGRAREEGAGGVRSGPSRDTAPPPDGPAPDDPPHDEPAPFLGSWALLYGVVFLNLVALIALFTWFTRAFE